MNKKNEQKGHRAIGTILGIFSLSIFLGISCQGEKEVQTSPVRNSTYVTMTKYTIALYGTGADSVERATEKPGRVFLLEGRGGFSWQVDIPEAGKYKVALCYASDRDGSLIELTAGASNLIATIPETQGYYLESNIRWQHNFERIALDGIMELSAGQTTISFRFKDPIPKTIMYFRSLELIPTFKKDLIEKEIENAEKERVSTDWLVNGGYGLMLHWTSKSTPKDGPHQSFEQAVINFDVDAFAELVESTGAKHILFTVGHAESYCPAPIKAWDELHPGMTTERDLLMELADKLDERNIKFMIYMNSPNMAKMGKVSAKQYLGNHRKILTEIGERYKNKIVAYCFDSWYQGYEEYPDFQFEELYKMCKIGYPDRLAAFNTWILPIVTPWQDFWFGETYIPGHPPKTRIMQDGPGRGLQYHSLIVLEDLWVHHKPGEMEPPWLSADVLGEYIKSCMTNKGAVTINVGIYQEGTFGEKSLEILKKLKQMVRDS
jgi:hypothetical protein